MTHNTVPLPLAPATRELVEAALPERSGVMQGFPPAQDRLVTATTGNIYPNQRWWVRNDRRLRASMEVRRLDPTLPFAESPRDLGGVSYTTVAGAASTVDEYLETSFIDGFIVLHKGRIVYESYPGMAPHDCHMWFSGTKSLTGLLTMMLVIEGKIDLDAPLSRYVPEMAGRPCGDASVQHNLDMAVAIRFPADQPYNFGYRAAMGFLPHAPGQPSSIFEYITSSGLAHASLAHGELFLYQNISPEALGLAIERIEGKPYSEVLCERLWSHLGAERDAFVTLDRTGQPVAAGGFNCTLRDAARLCEMLRNDGTVNGRRVVRSEVMAELFRPAHNQAHYAAGNLTPVMDKAYAGREYSYRNFWYQHNDGRLSVQARGILGQIALLVPRSEMVVVQFASAPEAAEHSVIPNFNRVIDAILRLHWD